MEFSQYTQILFDRIKKIEPVPANALKILGCLFLQNQDITQLASYPDIIFQELIYKTKLELQSPISPISPLNSGDTLPLQFSPPSRSFMSPRSLRLTSAEQQLPADLMLSDLQTQAHFLSLEENLGSDGFSNDFCYSDGALSNLGIRTGRRHQNLPEFPLKTCHYFNKGYCKHGSNCKYIHGQVSDNFPQIFGHNPTDAVNEDPIFSLEKLELELVELLKVKRGDPVSIASLPLLYYEKYGKVLQADGYLTESQRHGKAGYSLTKLLARLKNAIRVIDRPHGQHAVILAEDAPKYMDNRNDKNDPGPIVSGSRQIYLTFPAESTFTEEDVSNYFSNYGQVEDVRIPCQQKRMFGFVTFVSADTVKMILEKRNPHYVCGARVLVKPYREKSKLVDRKYQDRIESPMYYSPHYIDMESELQSIPRGYAASRLFRKQLIEEPEQIFQFERRRPSEMHLAQKPLAHQPFFGYSTDQLKVSEDQHNVPSTELDFLMEALNISTASDEKIKHVESKNNDQESEGLDLPDSPFSTAIASSISAVI